MDVLPTFNSEQAPRLKKKRPERPERPAATVPLRDQRHVLRERRASAKRERERSRGASNRTGGGAIAPGCFSGNMRNANTT